VIPAVVVVAAFLAVDPSPSPDTTPIVCDSCAEWNVAEPPFRLYGNASYVGTHGLSSVLITTSQGLILIDGDLPQSVPLIAANIRALGHRLADLKWIAVSHAHFDHVGGVAALARLSGAKVAASPATAAALRAGAPPSDDPQAGFGASMRFPPVAKVVELGDGATIRLGDVTVTAHHTPGHTPGSTSWSWRSCEQDGCRDLVYADSLNPVSAPGFRYSDDPVRVRRFQQSIEKVRALPCDILVSAHPSFSHLFERRAARDGDPSGKTNPLLDPTGCRIYADEAAAKLQSRLREERAIEVAVTIDDLPRHCPQAAGKEPAQIAAAMLAVFARHHLPEVYGFVNAQRLDEHPGDRAVLDAWIAAGQPLGNHTFSHADLDQVPTAAFLDEIDRDEPLLTKLARPGSPRWFRYPYLHEGKDREQRAAVRTHLAARGYRIAQVTIDPYDWSYNETYVRCLATGSSSGLAAVRASLLDEARARLRWAVAAAPAVAGRPIRHVLLLHLGAIDADTIDALLTAYEQLGVRWISLEDAMADPIYATDLPDSRGGVFLRQLFRARGATPPPLEPTAAPWRGKICPPPTPPP
jgi:metallo-beta-lactamase class B